MKEVNQLELIKKPIEWRDYCNDISSQYQEDIVDSNKVSFKEFDDGYILQTSKKEIPCTREVVNSIDKLTGFTPILKEYTKTMFKEESKRLPMTPNEVRNIYLSQNTSKKLRVLNFANEGIVGITDATRSLLRPTIVSHWVSIMAYKRDLTIKPSPHSRFFFSPYAFTSAISSDEEVGVNFDKLNYNIGFTYDPSKTQKMNLNSYILRLVCSNGSVVMDKGFEWSVPFNHDNGAWRSKLETLVSKQLVEKNQIKEWIEDLSEIHLNDVEDHAARWSQWKKIPESFRESIIAEYNDNSLNQSAYDFFNAITAARHRIDKENPESVHIELSPLAGQYLEEQFGKTGSRLILSKLLEGHYL